MRIFPVAGDQGLRAARPKRRHHGRLSSGRVSFREVIKPSRCYSGGLEREAYMMTEEYPPQSVKIALDLTAILWLGTMAWAMTYLNSIEANPTTQQSAPAPDDNTKQPEAIAGVQR